MEEAAASIGCRLWSPWITRSGLTWEADPAVILVTKNSSDAQWFGELLLECTAVCWPRGRLQWHTTLQGHAVFYFGSNPRAFEAAFEEFGRVTVGKWETSHPKLQARKYIHQQEGETHMSPAEIKTDEETTVSPLTEPEAKRLTQKITLTMQNATRSITDLTSYMQEAKDGRAWEAMNYASPAAWVEAELEDDLWKLSVAARNQYIVMLSGEMTRKELASAFGVDERTIQRARNQPASKPLEGKVVPKSSALKNKYAVTYIQVPAYAAIVADGEVMFEALKIPEGVAGTVSYDLSLGIGEPNAYSRTYSSGSSAKPDTAYPIGGMVKPSNLAIWGERTSGKVERTRSHGKTGDMQSALEKWAADNLPEGWTLSGTGAREWEQELPKGAKPVVTVDAS